MRARIYKLDSFTSRRFAGNPAAVMVLERYPDSALLQAIAEENNLSETAFAVPDGAVSSMAERIAAMHPARALSIVHLSGAQGLDALAAVAPNPRGSFHPLQSPRIPRRATRRRRTSTKSYSKTPTCA